MSGARHVLHRDIETRSTLDLTDVGAWRYAGDPNTDIWCIGFAIDDGPVQLWIPGQPVPEEFHVAAPDPEWSIAAHNDFFETSIETHILAPRYGWPLVPIERHRCSMAAALASALPGSLKRAAEALGLPGKDTEGARLMRLMSRPRKPRAGEDPDGVFWHSDPEKLERLYAYCRNDVEVERELYHRLPPLADSEQALWILDAVINRRGFQTDGPLLEAASRIAATASEAVQEELARITAGELDSTNQVTALLAWLGEHGCEVKNLQKPTLKHALRRKELDPVARRVIELRLGAAHAAAAKIDSLLAWRDTDGRVRGTLRYHGAGTGRWTGHGPQPQNFKRDGEDIEAKRIAIATGDLAHVQELYPQPLEVVGDIARAMICAAPGHRLLIGDFSGIESRVTAWVSGQQSKLDQWTKFDRTGDPKDEPYYTLGRGCGQPEESARKIGKTADLAFGYMGGPGAWDRLAPEDDASSVEDKRRYQQTWRRLHPQTVQFWYSIDRAAIAAIRKPGASFTYKRFTLAFDSTFLRIALPSGRALSYPFPRLETGKYGHPMALFKDNAAGKWTDCRYGQGAYGGLWTENIVQAVSRDLLAAAMQRLEAAGYRITLHVHDEIVAEVPIGFGGIEEFQHLITTLPDWAEGLPIAAKVRNGERFSKSEKLKADGAIDGGHGDALDDILGDSTESAGHPGSDQSEITHRQPFVSVAPEADRRPAVENPVNSGAPDDFDAILAAAYHAQKPSSESGDEGIDDHVGDDEDPADSGGAGANNGAAGSTFSGDPELGPYIYRDASGNPHARVVRTPNSRSRFTQQHWTGTAWASGMPKHRLPYRLPELLAADPTDWVCITEGEKDCVNVAKLGFVATTNPNGAKGWNSAKLVPYFAHLRRIAILEDNDVAGRERTKRIIKTLRILDPMPDIRVVPFPELPEGSDVSDWLKQDQSRGRAELLARIEAVQAGAALGEYVMVRASDIVPRPLDWLWPGHLLRGSQELLTGVPGNGKSQIHCAFVAYITTGGAWPDGGNGAPAGNVIMLTAEDCLDQTIVPRLIATGADCDRVFVLKKIRKDNKERMFLLSEDLDELERMINKVGDVRLITIDPITAYMGGKLDSHRATDVRGQLGPLADLAERMDVALSAITHPPKHATQRAIDHFIGSQAFIAAARIGHMTIEEVSEDEHGNKTPTGRALFTNSKNNVSRKMSTLAYHISEKQLAGGIKAAYVTWEEIVDITADQAIAAAMPSKERGQQSDIVIFLMNILAEGPTAIKTIEDKAAERRFSRDQLHRAKRKMNIVAFKEEGTLEGRWFWALPQHAPAKSEPE